MIRGHKPGWYFSTADGEGIRLEGEGHSCVHCQFCWRYVPGSGTRRGYCLRCDGWLCGRAECEALQKMMLARFPRDDRHCMPYSDYIERLRDAYDHDPRYKVLPSGIVVIS